MSSTDIVVQSENWATLKFRSLRAEGRVSPRLAVGLEARSSVPERRVRVVQMWVGLFLDNELLSMGWMQEPGIEIDFHERQTSAMIPLGRDAVRFIQEAARSHTIPLKLVLSGTVFIRHDGSSKSGHGYGMLAPGEWHLTPIREAALPISVALSDWVKLVLEPIGFGEYVQLQFPLPRGPDEERWRNALDHLRRADEQFAMGNDPGVFQFCRAVFEGLEGAPKQILAGVQDEEKRDRVNELLRQSVQYFHTGRHVSGAGARQGVFPVDHRDAEFALGLAKLLMGYISKLLASS